MSTSYCCSVIFTASREKTQHSTSCLVLFLSTFANDRKLETELSGQYLGQSVLRDSFV